MKPIHTIEGTECKECNGFGKIMQLRHQPSVSRDITCKFCQGKGKSPTTLIFKAEDFKCGYCNGTGIMDGFECDCEDCKGTELILPKKNEVRCANCSKPYSEGEDESRGLGSAVSYNCCENPTPFHLTSDAEVKMANDLKWAGDFLKQTKIVMDLIDSKVVITKDSKIVICEGYYE